MRGSETYGLPALQSGAVPSTSADPLILSSVGKALPRGVELAGRLVGLRQVVRIDSAVRHGPAYRPLFCLAPLEHVLPEQLPSLTQDLPAQFMAQALGSTGLATTPLRRLPGAQVVWLVLCWPCSVASASSTWLTNWVWRPQRHVSLSSLLPCIRPLRGWAKSRLSGCSNRLLQPGPCAAQTNMTFTACRPSPSTEPRCASQTPQKIAITVAARIRSAGRANIRFCAWSR